RRQRRSASRVTGSAVGRLVPARSLRLVGFEANASVTVPSHDVPAAPSLFAATYLLLQHLERPIGVDVHVQLGFDYVEQPPVGADHEADAPIEERTLSRGSECARDRAIGIRQEREVEGVSIGEASLLVGAVFAD